MAANIEQMFQDFILNKIKEIEDQNEDRCVAKAAGGELVRVKEAASDMKDESRGRSSQKKHKKHKKHKSKKKRRNREKEEMESSSESGADLQGGTGHRPRKGTPAEVNMVQGEDNHIRSRFHKRHSAGKRKKKKRKRKAEENSSDSDSEFVSKQRHSKSAQSLSPRRREELPDIIPKQDSSNKDREDEGRNSRSCSCSRSHSHSCSGRRDSGSWSRHCHRRSRTPSLSGSQHLRIRSSSSEKTEALGESLQSTQGPSKGLQPPQLLSSPPQRNIRAEEPTESISGLQNPDKSENTSQTKGEKAEDRTQKLAPGSGASKHVLNQSISAEPDQTAEPGFPQLRASECHRNCATDSKSQTRKKRRQSKSPHRKKEVKSSKRHKRSKSASRSRRRSSRSRSLSKKNKSRSRSGGRRSRRSRSRSESGGHRRATYSQRDRWKRDPSYSPVLILRKNRSPNWKHCSSSSSPQRISELDKDQLLEIAKANAAAMCAKAGMPIPASLRSTVLPLALPSMAINAAMASMTAATMTAALSNMGTLSSLLPLPSITNKPPPVAAQPNIPALEEVKRKVAKQANSISIKEFTDVGLQSFFYACKAGVS